MINLLIDNAFKYISVFIYIYIIYWSGINYLYEVWNYWGFNYELGMNIYNSFFICFIFIFIQPIIPSKLDTPSSVAINYLYYIVFIPTIVLTLLQVNFYEYISELIALCIGFILIVAITKSSRDKLKLSIKNNKETGINLPNNFIVIFGFVLCFIYFLVTKSSLIGNFSLLDVYLQRELGAANSAIEGYLQTWFIGFFSTGMIALGIVKKKFIFTLMGFSGFALVFLYTAQRSILILPLLLILFIIGARIFKDNFKAIYIPLALSLIIIVFSLSISEPKDYAIDGNVLYFGAQNLVLFRLIGVPALLFSQYIDTFSYIGHTYFYHIKPFSMFIDIPIDRAYLDSWPGLGYIVSEFIYGDSENNANANFFASDGIASLGGTGVIIVSIILSLWLKTFDHLTKVRHADVQFFSIILLSQAFFLSNGPFSLILFSFGGLFWLAVLFLMNIKFKLR